LLDQIPDVAVGQMGMGGRAGEFPGFADLVENSEHHHGRLRTAFLVKSPDGFDLDVVHGMPNL